MPEPSEFYVGYFPSAPTRIAAIVARVVAGLVGLSLGVAVMATSVQNPPVPSAWDDTPVTRRGVLIATPYPILYVRDDHGAVRGVQLSAVSKHGLIEPADFCGPGETVPADPEREKLVAALRAADGQVVTLSGTILAREGRELLETTAVTSVDEGATADGIPALEDLGDVELAGEIVDPKCYFGAMKPAQGQTHRACAIRCVLGGITPVLVAHDRAGRLGAYILTDAQGRPANQLVRGRIADPVRVQGRLTRRGDALFLALKPAGILPANVAPRKTD